MTDKRVGLAPNEDTGAALCGKGTCLPWKMVERELEARDPDRHGSRSRQKQVWKVLQPGLNLFSRVEVLEGTCRVILCSHGEE